jgi:hypothetical protein
LFSNPQVACNSVQSSLQCSHAVKNGSRALTQRKAFPRFFDIE